eukprot:XP_019918102.1 PREDICTED: uncharacterized protein LOC105348796 [Crassostrea gigas]
MKVFLAILMCLQLGTCSGLLVPDIAFLAYDVITLGIDFIDRLTSGDDLGKVQESIDNLQNSVNELHGKLDYTTQIVEHLIHLMNQQPYKISLSQHVEKIKSCKTDLENVLQKPTSTAARENFRKCYDIIGNVRAIGGYLSGHAIVGLPPFFELYRHKDGYYRGPAIKTMFQYLYTYFIDGCTVVVAAERLAFCRSSTLYKEECLKTVADINSYIRNFYRKCITQSCYWFHSQATELFNRPEVVDVSSANNVLENNFPWFQFLVIQSSASDSTVDNDGTFHVNSKTFAVQKTYHIFWTDSFVRFVKNSTDGNKQFINVTISHGDYVGSSYGMNLSKQSDLAQKQISFVGYSSDHNMDTCQYPQGSGGPPPAPSNGEFPKTSIFVFVASIAFLFI